MKTRSRQVRALLLLLAAAGCVGEPPIAADDELNWYLDVQPILRANCFHCHGASPAYEFKDTEKWEFTTHRWDICDPEADVFADILPAFGADSGITPGRAWSKRFQVYVLPPGQEHGRGSMPPPPAADLTGRDKEVLLRWARQNGDDLPTCGSRVDNLRPRVALVGRAARSGDTLTATLDVTDGDHDQVLGKLTCGTAEAPIRSSGRVTVTLDVTDLAPGSATLTALVSDGLDRTQRNLGACP